MVARNIRIEEDLVDHLFNSSEKRLARTLLLLAQYGGQETSQHVLPKLSQELLAEMVGTTDLRPSRRHRASDFPFAAAPCNRRVDWGDPPPSEASDGPSEPAIKPGGQVLAHNPR